MSGIIDAHQHVWDLERAEYAWLGPDSGPLYRNFEHGGRAAGAGGGRRDRHRPRPVRRQRRRHRPHVRGRPARTRSWSAIVGYVPLDQPDRAAVRLAELQREPLFCGVRALIHDRADPHYLQRGDVDATLGLLEDAGIPFDVVGVLPEHLRAVLAISERHPRLKMVLDHLNKPPIGASDREPWASLIGDVAANPLVYGKVSGLYSAVGQPGDWTVDTIRPVFEHALDVFGADRLMYGGDWPVSLIAGGYTRVWRGIEELLAGLPDDDRQAILAGTARTFYQLDNTKGNA